MPKLPDTPVRGRRWRRAAIAALALVALAGSFSLVWNFDVFWHLAAGQWMCRNLAVLAHDPFSIDPQPQWVNVHWLFQLVIASLHAIGGFAALSVMKAALAAAMILVFALSLRRHVPASWLVLCGLATLHVAATRIRVRPEAFTFVYLMAAFAITEGVRRGGSPRRLWWLVPLMVLWVNMHGLYILGLGVVWAAVVGAFVDRLLGRGLSGRLASQQALAPVLAATGACLISPWPVRAAAHPLLLWSRVSGEAYYYTYGVSELTPTLEALPKAPDVVLLVIAVAIGMLINWRGVPIAHLLWLAAFLGVAAMAMRNVGLTGPVCGYLLAWHGGAVIRRLARARPILARAGPYAAAAMVLLALAATAGYATEFIYDAKDSNVRFGAGLDETNYPQGLARWLAELEAEGDVFCDNFGDASLFIYHFSRGRAEPKRLLFMDGRLEAHSLERFIEQNRIRQELRTVTLAEKVRLPKTVRFVIVRGDAAGPLPALSRSERFRLVRLDKVAACFEDLRWARRQGRRPAPLRPETGSDELVNLRDFDRPLTTAGSIAGAADTPRTWYRLNQPNVSYAVGRMLLYLGEEDPIRGGERLDAVRQRCELLAIRYLTAAQGHKAEDDRIIRGALATAYQQRMVQCGFVLWGVLPAEVHSARALWLYRGLDLADLEDDRMLMFALQNVRTLLQSHQFDAADRAVRAIMEALPPRQRVNPPLQYLNLRGTVIRELDRVEARLAQRGLAGGGLARPAGMSAAAYARQLIALDVGLVDRAIRVLQAAGPLDAEAAMLLGDLLLRRGRAADARDTYRRLGQRLPEDPRWRACLGGALCEWVAGRPFAAAAALDALAERAERPLIRYYQAMLYQELGQYERASAAEKRLAGMAEAGGAPEDRYLHALLLQNLGRLDEAATAFAKVETADAETRALVEHALSRLPRPGVSP
jgi:hypothetical protein